MPLCADKLDINLPGNELIASSMCEASTEDDDDPEAAVPSMSWKAKVFLALLQEVDHNATGI